MKAVKNLYQAETQEQNVFEMFEDYLNSLYYEGYADQLANENLESFEFELNQFIYNF